MMMMTPKRSSRAIVAGATALALGALTGASPTPAPGEDTLLIGLSVLVGTHLSGDLTELEASDDTYVRTRSAFGVSAFEPNLMELAVYAASFVDEPTNLDVTIESRLNHPGGTAKVRLRNWKTGDLVQVAQYPLGTTDETVTIENLDATAFHRIADATAIEMSLKHVVFAVFSLAGFESSIDHVRFDLGVE